MAKLIAIVSLLLLAGCGTTGSGQISQFEVTVERTYLEPAPSWMTEQCPPLPKLPRKELSQAEVEKLWHRDQQLYHECRTKHAAYARWIQQRDEAFLKGAR